MRRCEHPGFMTSEGIPQRGATSGGFRFEDSPSRQQSPQSKGSLMAQDFGDFAEEILAGAMAAVIRHYESIGHMPEHAIYQAMLRLQAALPRACSQAGIDNDFHEFAKIDIKQP
jgi:hypothetical protein